MLSVTFWRFCIAIVSVVTLNVLIISCSDDKDAVQHKPIMVKHADDEVEVKEAILQIDLEIGRDESDLHQIFNQLSEVRTDKYGNLYLLDSGDDHLIKFSAQGEYITQIGKGGGSGPGEFKNATFFDIDGEGRIYVYDLSLRRISILDNHGEFLDSFFVEEPVGDMAVDSEGNIYLLLRELFKRKGTPAYLWKYARKDEYRENAGQLLLTEDITYQIGPPPGDVVVSTMDTGPSGELFICFFKEYTVRKFSPEGKLVKTFSRNIKKHKLHDFIRERLEKKVAKKPKAVRDSYKIPEYYPKLVLKLIVDQEARKVYIMTTEGMQHLKIVDGLPVSGVKYLDRFDLQGNLEERFKITYKEILPTFRDIRNGKFVSMDIMSKKDFTYQLTRYILTLKAEG